MRGILFRLKKNKNTLSFRGKKDDHEGGKKKPKFQEFFVFGFKTIVAVGVIEKMF